MELTALSRDRLSELLSRGALLVDLRPVDDYLTEHAKGSVSLIFEDGPGFPGRARDLLPLQAHLVLIDDSSGSADHAAAMLRAKGFDVAGYSVDTNETTQTPQPDIKEFEGVLLDVRDPGAVVPEGATVIPVEWLWARAGDLDSTAEVGVLAGWGVRAATAVGILERLGFEKISFVRTRPVGSLPPTTASDPTIFRVSGV
ncbi:MAG TPA: rhodanese-like domain-containing protein [Actinomycetota bacterium]|nr:rhodanese-like domain-containing protein [Actinomycetota bacterium]